MTADDWSAAQDALRQATNRLRQAILEHTEGHPDPELWAAAKSYRMAVHELARARAAYAAQDAAMEE